MEQADRYKILCCSSSMAGGGSERQMLNLVQGLDRTHFDPELYLLYASGALLEEVPDRIPLDAFWLRHKTPRLNWVGRIHLQQVKDVRAKIEQRKVDLVYDRLFHMTMITGQAVRGTQAARVSTIVSPPSHDVRHSERRLLFVKRWLLSRAYRTSDRLLAVSQSTANDAATFYRIPQERFEVVESPIDIEKIDRLILMPWEGAALPNDRKHIVSIGRLSDEKGHPFLLQAVANLIRKSSQRFSLHLVGDGPMRAELIHQCQQLGISQQVIFHGHVSNPYSLLSRCDLLVLPSLYEGLPNVVLEAMACRVPVVATAASGSLLELMAKTHETELVPPANVELLVAAMQQALAEVEAWPNRCIKVRRYVEEHHGLPQWLVRMQEIFTEAIRKKRGT